VLQVTERAIDHLEGLRRKKGFDERVGVRFVRNGERVALTFARGPKKGDRVVPRDRIPVYLASEVADTFDHSIVDAKTADERTWLVLRPQRKATPKPS
jgi:Fe-S cluster assembly iron-binding protein IscA